MAKVFSTPQSKQRARVFDAYRGRGRRTNQLWLVYSVKTNRDWIWASDRQLVHWLVFLEANPSVLTFDFPEPSMEGFRNESIVDVQLSDGSRERHTVFSDIVSFDSDNSFVARNGISSSAVKQKFFCDTELKPLVPLAMRWHKALCFAAVLRDQEQLSSRIALVSAIKARGSGIVRDLLADIQNFDEALVLGMLVRIAIEGFVTLNLTDQGFCYATPWQLVEVSEHVVS